MAKKSTANGGGDATKQLMVSRMSEIRGEIEAIQKQAAPLRKRIDEGYAEVEAARAGYKALKEEVLPELKEIEAPLVALQDELSRLALATGGRRTSDV